MADGRVVPVKLAGCTGDAILDQPKIRQAIEIAWLIAQSNRSLREEAAAGDALLDNPNASETELPVHIGIST